MKRKINTRKDNCTECNVSTGSVHSKGCKFEFALPKDSKMYKIKKRGLITKIKQAIEVFNN